MAAACASGIDAGWNRVTRDDQRGEEVRGVQHAGRGRLERRARAGDLGKVVVQQLKQEPGRGRQEFRSGKVAMRYEPRR